MRPTLGYLLLVTGLSLGALTQAEAGRVGPGGLDGEIDCDLPGEYHRQNVGSRGQGCCVQTSIGHSARYQDVPALVDFQVWVQQKGLPGGGNPGRVDERIPACARDRGFPTPAYLQAEGPDTLDLLKAACRSGRMPAVTYDNAGDPLHRYDGHRIAHMVSLVGADVGSGHWWVILDNNYPGAEHYGWLTEAEFRRTYAEGWTVILLAAGPPPPPRNNSPGPPAPLPPLRPTPRPPGPRP